MLAIRLLSFLLRYDFRTFFLLRSTLYYRMGKIKSENCLRSYFKILSLYKIINGSKLRLYNSEKFTFKFFCVEVKLYTAVLKFVMQV